MRSRLLSRLVLCAALLSGSAGAAPPSPEATLAAELTAGQHPGVTSFLLGDARSIDVRYVDAALRDEAPDIRSATKSVTALLVGIAIDRGLLASVRTPIREHLPEYADAFAADPAKAALTFEDLLTMRSGLDCDDWNPDSPGHEDRMYRRRDWVAYWLERKSVATPGTRFAYCTGNVVALGKALAHAVGQPVDTFADAALFAPLGIRGARWARWNRDREIDTGGHLRIAPDDLHAIGRLVLARGVAGERRIVSAQWVDAMTTARTDIPGRKQRYGYLWWLDATHDPALPSTRLQFALGNGGNLLVVLPELGRVLVFTGTRFNQPQALEPMFWLRDRLMPAMRAAPADVQPAADGEARSAETTR